MLALPLVAKHPLHSICYNDIQSNKTKCKVQFESHSKPLCMPRLGLWSMTNGVKSSEGSHGFSEVPQGPTNQTATDRLLAQTPCMRWKPVSSTISLYISRVNRGDIPINDYFPFTVCLSRDVPYPITIPWSRQHYSCRIEVRIIFNLQSLVLHNKAMCHADESW